MILEVGIQAFMYQQIDLLSAVVDKSSLQNAFCICNSYIYALQLYLETQNLGMQMYVY